MRTKAIQKKAISLALAFTLLAVFCLSALADDDRSAGPAPLYTFDRMTATVMATEISVTHPTIFSYTINPNTNTLAAPDISIKNTSVAAITVSINSFHAARDCYVTDVLPTAKDWDNLSNEDSQKYVSIGLTAKASDWLTGYSTTTYYSANTATALIGTLKAGGTGAFTLSAYYGKSFKSDFTLNHSLCFTFDLA